jgi:hypothetical protein
MSCDNHYFRVYDELESLYNTLKKIQRISPSDTQPTAIGGPWTMYLEDFVPDSIT